MRFLKQSTATTLLLGPFLDETDGKTAETALTISQSDVLLWKEGGTTLAQKNEATSCTHRSNGLYTCPVNATDTNTLGTLVVSVSESGALPIRLDYEVLPANVYDSLVLGTDLLQIDVEQVDGSANAATFMSIAQLLQQTDTVTNAGFSPTTTEFEATTIATATADHWIGRRVYFTSGTLQYQGSKITDYALSGGRGHFTVETLTSAPANGVSFIII
jgi:hypothetical protein